ncbi:MAG: DUF3179 domain-containing (seleno)protein, partial [Candidatus Hodarchaeales archaeon]
GYSRSYDRNPYDFYQEIINEDIWFPTSYDWRWRPYSLYPPKTHTLVISLNNMTRLYSFEELTKQQFVNDKHGNQSYVVMYDEENKLSIAFSSVHNDHEYCFAPAKSGDYADSETFGLPIFQDNETQSVWNMRGQAIAGSLKGAQLEQLPGYNAFWFAATVFSEQATLFQAEFIEAPPSKTSQTGFQIINVFAFAGAIALVAWWGFKRRRNLPKK